VALRNGVTAIAGVGQTEFSKDSGRSELQLASEAVKAALGDAGLTPHDVDGLVTMTVDINDELSLMRSVGIGEVSWTSRTPFGGGGSKAMLQHAAAAVASGAAEVVVCYRAFNERSATRFGQPSQGQPSQGQPGQRQGAPPGWNWYLPFGLDTPAKIYSLWYQRYMTTYGLTNEDFGRYTVVARKHAANNPNAWFYQRPITLEDHQKSRWIAPPVLRLLDCCQESDGGVAMVVTSADRARSLRHPLVTIEGATQGHLSSAGDNTLFNFYGPDLAWFEEAEHVGRQLYDGTGLKASDIDAAMIYENFSPVVFLQLEAFGFCARGEARDFIKDGHIELAGTLPVNTHGGLLGEAYIHGLNNVIEGVRQIRGTAINQVPGAARILCAAGHSALILGNGDRS
jgi:acetyl-CoA acetyltransferase